MLFVLFLFIVVSVLMIVVLYVISLKAQRASQAIIKLCSILMNQASIITTF